MREVVSGSPGRTDEAVAFVSANARAGGVFADRSAGGAFECSIAEQSGEQVLRFREPAKMLPSNRLTGFLP